jgi:cytidylate kinase
LSEHVTVIAVDGPAASGKSTVSRATAKMLGFHYVDTGAMYRTVTWKALEEGIDVEDTVAVIGMMHKIKISFELVGGEVRMLIDGVYPGDAIRAPRVTEKVSVVAAIPEVRQILVQHQRSLTKFGSLVMEGRDIGSVVFADSPYKFYLDAPAEVRAVRRQRDLEKMGTSATEKSVKESLLKRDLLDSARAAAPLQIPLGAVVIDTKNMTVEENARFIVEKFHEIRARLGESVRN